MTSAANASAGTRSGVSPRPALPGRRCPWRSPGLPTETRLREERTSRLPPEVKADTVPVVFRTRPRPVRPPSRAPCRRAGRISQADVRPLCCESRPPRHQEVRLSFPEGLHCQERPPVQGLSSLPSRTTPVVLSRAIGEVDCHCPLRSDRHAGMKRPSGSPATPGRRDSRSLRAVRVTSVVPGFPVDPVSEWARTPDLSNCHIGVRGYAEVSICVQPCLPTI